MDTEAEAGYAARWTIEGTSGEKTVTEAEWVACNEPEKMLEFLRHKMSDRKKLFLFLAGVSSGPAEAYRAYCNLLRCIFGNPFRPVSLDPSWLSWHDGLVGCLAQAAFDERHLPSRTLDNVRLAILADALEEAGCTDADILSHLRGPGTHVHGCWAVDLCLGKS
jgi:hypothetical protein